MSQKHQSCPLGSPQPPPAALTGAVEPCPRSSAGRRGGSRSRGGSAAPRGAPGRRRGGRGALWDGSRFGVRVLHPNPAVGTGVGVLGAHRVHPLGPGRWQALAPGSPAQSPQSLSRSRVAGRGAEPPPGHRGIEPGAAGGTGGTAGTRGPPHLALPRRVLHDGQRRGGGRAVPHQRGAEDTGQVEDVHLAVGAARHPARGDGGSVPTSPASPPPGDPIAPGHRGVGAEPPEPLT